MYATGEERLGEQAQARTRISEGLNDLLYRLHSNQPGYAPDPESGQHCDVLIIGSGYGAATAAAALAETLGPSAPQQRVWMLERGQAFLPGEFANQLGELPGQIRFNTKASPHTKGNHSGLFDVRLGDDANVLVANGLGGGSLINAGVMAWPQDDVFRQPPWPKALSGDLPDLRTRAEHMMRELGAVTPDGAHNTILRQGTPPPKFDALQRISKGEAGTRQQFQATPVTIAFEQGTLSSDNVRLRACNRCGDCATGCNQGAKISLDTNLLHSAARRGVKIFTGATVMRISRTKRPTKTDVHAGWIVHVRHTEPQMQWRHGPEILIQAKQVILAAGTLGSTGILLRSRQDDLCFSNRLGERFSSNGDLVTVAFDQSQQVNAIANASSPADQRGVGPTITAMIDRRAVPGQSLQHGYVVQDLAVPAALARLFGELNTSAHAIHRLPQFDSSQHAGGALDRDPQAVCPEKMARTFPLAIIGHDGAQGQIRFTPPATPNGERPDNRPYIASDSNVDIHWPTLPYDACFDKRVDDLSALLHQSGTHGTLLPDPGWQPLPKSMDFLVKGKRGAIFTAHPLGGCAMGTSVRDGVVDHLGRVFDPNSTSFEATHPGLVVMDGSIIPTSLGINPSLTISVLADRAIRQLRQMWGFGQAHPDQGALSERVIIPARPLPPPHASTCIEITEQLRGNVGRYGIEITLRFEEVAVAHLISPDASQRRLNVNVEHSFLRIIDRQALREDEAWDKAPSLLHAHLSGHMRALHRASTGPLKRLFNAGTAWALNRGLRDITQNAFLQLTGLASPDLSEPGLRKRIHNVFALASRAGEVRLLDYELVIQDPVHPPDPASPWAKLKGQRVHGHKHLSYTRRGNPWRQLTTLILDECPELSWASSDRPRLQLNTAYLAKIGVPLVRITQQHDRPSALMDLLSLALLFARVLINIHVWALRAPDDGPVRQAQRLPGFVPQMPPPIITELDVDKPLPDGTPVRIRLTHYPTHAPGMRPHPLVMLHGYSASGTTFAHHSVQPGLAKYLWDKGHDIWLIDVRTSSGMPTATHPWVFEDPALTDIPTALDYVANACDRDRVNVIAHCMGSAMLWMSLLAQADHTRSLPPATQMALARLQGDPRSGRPSLIHRLVMSQITPLIQFGDDNLLRSFLMRHMQHYLSLGHYQFALERDSTQHSAMTQLFERLLSTLPYADSHADWSIENPNFPPWRTTPWTRTRRRMDILYGRDFNLGFIEQPVLTYLDDHFGPLNLSTLSQTLHFARARAITDPFGNTYLHPERLRSALDGMDAMMSVHGEQNMLSNIRGMYEFHAYVSALGIRYANKYKTVAIPKRGHQDCLIGRNADKRVYVHVADFLEGAQT